MTTKPPASIREFTPESLEKIAYSSVSTIPVEESNDRNRLGYHVFRWLVNKNGTIEEAVTESDARMHISVPEAVIIIREALQKSGVL